MVALLGRARRLDAQGSAALARVLDDPSFELIPLRNAHEQAAALPRGATVTVTASPSKPIEATVDLAIELEASGLRAIPHLSARMFRDRAHLAALVDRLGGAGVDRAFVVGGDSHEHGAFADGLSVLRAMADMGRLPAEVGIPCYPQGHPFISDDRLVRALHEKAPFAQYMTTQLCFEPTAIRTFIEARRAEGIALAVQLGIPGVAEIPKLLNISARIGISDASRFVLKNMRFVGQLLRGGGTYRPTALIRRLAPLIADPRAGVVGLHLYTFNNVDATEAWRIDMSAEVATR
jgi:methylenetetrahydrofolate reductase (NADPH)